MSGSAVARVSRDTWRAVLVTALAFLTALIIGAVIIVVSDPDILARWSYFFAQPGDALSASWRVISSSYGALVQGSVGSVRAISETLVTATPLTLAALGIALAFRAGLFNIGGEGQLILGALFAAFIGFAVPMPAGIHLLVAVAAGFVGGAMYGAIPGYLKARTGAHEVITTIMLNWISYNILLLALSSDVFRRPERADPISQQVLDTARLPALPGSQLRANLGFILVLLAAAAVAWLLVRSTVGFEFRAVGLNVHAARVAGMSIEGTTTLAMTLSGGLAGLGGATLALGVQPSLAPGFSSGVGFDAITVALLGRGNPWGVVAAGLLFGGLRAGGLRMQASTGTAVDLVLVIQALIILFIAAPRLVRALYRIRVRDTETITGDAPEEALSKGWSG